MVECTRLTDEERVMWLRPELFDEGLRGRLAELPENARTLILDICECAAAEKFEAMHQAISENAETLAQNSGTGVFRELLKRAYEHAVACDDAGSCCNLGNMYHDTSNAGSDEDYAAAIELYELGVSRGNIQSGINLGYIYYYGRGTEVNYDLAYHCFAHAALLGDHPEALWKLGDLYASGKGVAQSDWVAFRLYVKSYDAASDSALAARAAHHIADYLLEGIDDRLEPDAQAALRFYAEAENGYSTLIAQGLTYYRRQLNQAIEGQRKARAALMARVEGTLE